MERLNQAFRTVTSLLRSPAKEVGLPPGTLVHVGQQKIEQSLLSTLCYNDERYQPQHDVSLEDCQLLAQESEAVSWINLDGVHDVARVDALGQMFGLHTLLLEDILNTNHPPKFEEFNETALIILKLFDFDSQSQSISAEQIALVLTPQAVLTFQERSGDVFERVRERLERKSGRIRQRGSDYLAYALLDTVVDSYFHVLEKVADHLDYLEVELVKRPTQERLQQVYQLKGQLVFLRKAVWPLRELIDKMLHSESELIDETTHVFLRDLYDHARQAQETIESFRDAATGLVELYMSSVSQRMNEVMQVLTVMASIFIPLTFIAGIYGMNFEFMPELKWRYGYAMVWGLIGLCVVAMLWFFRRKKWF